MQENYEFNNNLIESTVPECLKEFFKSSGKIALAFSGGVDSSYLLYAATICQANIIAYYVDTQFQPAFELEDARSVASQLGTLLKIIKIDVLADGIVRENPSNRCYYCKKLIFKNILQAAKEDGCEMFIDGTNMSDNAADRPGMIALRELKVVSPLKKCGISKEWVREYSKRAWLFTWDKPAYACLATRIAAGERITPEVLIAIEQAENTMFELGFRDFRVRVFAGAARIQIKQAQFALAIKIRERIIKKLSKYFGEVLLDLNARED